MPEHENETLEQRRDRIVAELANDDLSEEREAELLTEAASVREGIEARNRRLEQRAALLAAVPTQVTVDRPVAVTQTRDREQEPREERAADTFLREWRAAGANVGQNYGIETRALLDNSATSAGAFQNPQRPATVPLTFADRMPSLRDLIDVQQTDSNTVEYVREDTAAGGGAAAETAEGGLKPEAAYTFSVITDPVRTIAHWVPITRQAMDDNAQMRGYIEGRLRYGLDFRIDNQILNGNGTAPNLRGINNTTGVNTYAPGAAEAAVISIRKGITLVQQSEYMPDTVVLNPADWERVELSQDTQGMFRVSPNVTNALAPRIWGLNVVATTAQTAGTVTVGSFRQGATLWERGGSRVMVTDSHSDFFIRNQLVVLAEMRAALSVWRPKAFCKVTLNGTA